MLTRLTRLARNRPIIALLPHSLAMPPRKAAAAAAAAAASSSAATAVNSLFSPVRPPVPTVVAPRGSRRKRLDSDEEQTSQEQEEADVAAAKQQAQMEEEGEESQSKAKSKAKPSAAARAKKQKIEDSEPTIPEAAPTDAASSSSSSAAAAASSSSPSVATPSVLSFPASVLGQPLPAFGAAFDTMARNFLLNYELNANGTLYRLLEMEVYYRSVSEKEGHHDLFAHAHPVQLNNFGNWYWHRQGLKPDASYKGGNYKGMDVTCGVENGGGGHGGILIRSVQRIQDGKVIEGSCLVAEEVLQQHGGKSIVELVESWKGNTAAFGGANPTLNFVLAKHPITPAPKPDAIRIIRSPRVGLTLKQSGASRPLFINLPYRYCRVDVPGFANKKMKQSILLSGYAEMIQKARAEGRKELSNEERTQLQRLVPCTGGYLDQHMSAFEAGFKSGAAGMARFAADASLCSSAEGMSRMYGAWMAQFAAQAYEGGKHVAFLKA